MRCTLGLGALTMTSLLAIACGGSAPTSPSRAAAAGPSAAVAVAQSTPSALFGASAVDFARCLQAAEDSGCFAGAARMQPRTVGAAATAPGAPANLSTSSSGSSVTLTWGAPSSGDPVTTYIIEAGSGPGLANLANFTTNNTATSFSASGIGAGTYYVRIRAQNAGGTSAASNESILVVGSTGCTAAPNAPAGLVTTVSGSTVNLAWSAPSGGCAATSYVLEAGSGTGLSNLASFNTGSTATQYSASGVADGTYYVRVRAANATGNSAMSNEVIVTVGGSTLTGVSGTWIGLVANGDGTSLNSSDCGLEKADWRFDLTQTGSAVTGTLTQTTVVSRCDPTGLVKTAALTGTVVGATFTFAFTSSPSRSATATVTASRMTGSSSFAGTFALNRQ